MKNLVNKGFKYFVAIMMVFSLMSMNAWANGPESGTSSETGSTTTENKGTTKDTGDSQGDTADQLISNEEKKTTTSKESDDKEGQTDQTTDKKTDYTYEDKKISVKAVLANASAISDQAELRVKEIPESTTEYKKYQEALDKKSNLYSNVLLYDISFILDGKEVEPTDGNVKVSMSFKDQQLSDDLNVKDNNDLKVIHFKDNDVNKQESLKTTTSVKNETTSFETKSFSITAFVATTSNTNKYGFGFISDVDWQKDFVFLNGNVDNVNGKRVYFFNDELTDQDKQAIKDKGRTIKYEYHYITSDSETFTGGHPERNNPKTGYFADRALGIPGNFHIVAFDTATLNVHTNGNVLANNLIADTNFGTNHFGENGKPVESTYVANNYKSVHPTSASNEKNLLVLSKNTNIKIDGNNKDEIWINNTKMDKPTIFYKDSENKSFLDLSTCKTHIENISEVLKEMHSDMKSYNVTYENKNGNENYYTLNNPDGVGVINLKASDFNQNHNNIRFNGFKSGHSGTIIVNVDMSDATLEGNVKTLNLPSEEVMLDENGNRLGTGEVTDFKDGKIIWNFYNDENTKIVTGEMAGAVIAPHATLSLKSSFNGTAIAKNVSNETESHRTDFTGILQNDATSFFVQKSFSEGQQWPENSKYHFKFESVTNSTTKKQPMPENREIVIDSSTKDHTKAFGDITYSNEEDSNDEKYYYYKIEEDRDTGNDDYVDTVKYDTNVYYIRVKVKYTANVTLGIRKAEIEETSYIDTKTNSNLNDANVSTGNYNWIKFDRNNSDFKFGFKNSVKQNLSVTFNKSDGTNILSGAIFTFAKLNDNDSSNGEAIPLTENSGKYIADNLEDNTKYLLKETKAPDGYFTDGPWVLVIDKASSMKLYKATVNNGKVTGYDESTEIENKSSNGFEFNIVDKNNLKLELTKVEENTNKNLANANFSLKEVEIENNIINQTNNSNSKKQIQTTDQNGNASFDNLNVGKKYLLEETKAPDGYNKNGPWIVTVNDNEVTIQKVSIDKDNKVSNIGNPETKPIDKTKTQLFVSETISDSKGATLPSTGGTGTKKYYLLGTLLSMLGVIYIVMKLGKGGLFRKEDHS